MCLPAFPLGRDDHHSFQDALFRLLLRLAFLAEVVPLSWLGNPLFALWVWVLTCIVQLVQVLLLSP